MKLIKIASLIIAFILCSCLLNFIKNLFYKEEKTSSNQAAHHVPVISKKEEQELEEGVEKFQKNLFWNTPKHTAPLFTSRNYYRKNKVLLDPLEGNTMMYPPVPNQWLLEHELDYTDPNILSEDPSGDGFSNLEKWQGNDPYNNPGSSSLDPNDPLSRPLLWTKLRCYKNNFNKKRYHFYFLGLEPDSSEIVFLFEVEEEGTNGIIQGKNTMRTKIRHLKLGETIKDIPLKVIDFKENNTIKKEILYDISSVKLINTQTKEEWIIIKKSRLQPLPTIIEILDNISFEYILESPPKKISLACGESFVLESQAILNNSAHKDKEWYRLIRMNSTEATLEKEGHEYAIPILTSESDH